MYAVTFFKNRQPLRTYNFFVESNAIEFITINAEKESLNLSENKWYAKSGGTTPAMEISIEYFEQ